MKSIWVAVLLAVMLALSPAAFAKAGSGSSFGSRGSRTADRPMERSYTPPPASQSQPAYRPSTPYAAPMGAPRGSFFGGMLGGLAGFGLGHMLFGGSPGAGILGMLLQLGLLFFVGRWLLGLLRGRPQQPLRPAMFPQQPGPAAAAPRIAKLFEPTDADQQSFSAILIGVQKAWSEGDLATLRGLATPEIVAWLSEDLSRNASQGIHNIVTDVTLHKGEAMESWRDGDLEYVTALLAFTAHDYSVEAGGTRIVAGDPQALVDSTEAWTFVRRTGGRWLLSAVERK